MPTLGEYRVRTQFNPSQEALVDQLKQKYAELIDLLAGYRAGVARDDAETQRVVAQAMTVTEDAAMWAVKAVTSKPF